MKVTLPQRTAGATVKVNNNAGVLTQVPGQAVTLNNLGSIAKVNRLDGLADVVEINPQNGDILVYDASIDKYVVQSLDISNQNLDGGSF